MGCAAGVIAGPAIISHAFPFPSGDAPALQIVVPSLARTTVSTPGSKTPFPLLSTKPMGQGEPVTPRHASAASAFMSAVPPIGAVPARMGSSGYVLDEPSKLTDVPALGFEGVKTNEG